MPVAVGRVLAYTVTTTQGSLQADGASGGSAVALEMLRQAGHSLKWWVSSETVLGRGGWQGVSVGGLVLHRMLWGLGKLCCEIDLILLA